PAAFGLILLTSVWSRRTMSGAARAGFPTIFALTVCQFYTRLAGWDRTSPVFSPVFVFFPLSALLIGAAVPVLWSSAMIRADHPGDAALQRFGRVGAGLVQVGFVVEFAAHAHWLYRFGMTSDSRSLSGAGYAVGSTTEI